MGAHKNSIKRTIVKKTSIQECFGTLTQWQLLGRVLPVCFYLQPLISRRAAFGEMENASERLEVGRLLTDRFHFAAYRPERQELGGERTLLGPPKSDQRMSQ